MIDFKKLTNEKLVDDNGKSYLQRYTENLTHRGDDSSELKSLLDLNSERKTKILKFEEAKASQNKASAEIAQLKRNKEDASEQLKAMQLISKEVKGHEKSMAEVTEKFEQFLARFPNMVHESVPVGVSEEDNQLVDQWGEPGEYSFEVKNHIELGQSLGIIDFERAGKVAGARFSYLRGMGARLERGLIQFMMDRHAKDHGYTELIPPYIVNSASMYGTGQFPKFKEDVFHIEGSDYYLIPTSETSVTNLYAGEILKEEDLPENFVAFSPCFRSEAGSYGKDTQGLIRQHQFHKVELLKFSHPDDSYEQLEKLTSNAESILRDLEIPYRKMALCTGDISFGAAKCYDLEAWLPGQNKYREISSCSNFEDFQARRANIRYRPKGPKAKPQFVHTLNGSGLAVGRTLIAILENHQQEDGSIALPKAIQPYFGGDTKITPQ